MSTADAASLEVLQAILSQPTSPFHEERVAAQVIGFLREWEVPYTVDDAGNIVAHYSRGACEHPLVLMAHMDHPAFTVIGEGGPDGAHFTAMLEGGVAARYFEQPVAVRIFSSQDHRGAGVKGRVSGYAKGPGARELQLFVQVEAPEQVQQGDFGIWDLADYELRDDFVHGRAIDDLVGCAEMLLTLQRAAREAWNTEIYAVFTRAEEVGLVGAYAALERGSVPRQGVVVSLEASPLLPGVAHGAGPIIRSGDRRATFCQDAEALLIAAAKAIGAVPGPAAPGQEPAPDAHKVQRHLMNGGSCEGSAAVLLGYLATGMSIPLGNYHNMGPDAHAGARVYSGAGLHHRRGAAAGSGANGA